MAQLTAHHHPPLISLLRSIVAQALGFGIGFAAQSFGSGLIILAVHSIVAGVAATKLLLSKPWVILNAALPFALLVAVDPSMPFWALPAILIVLGVFYLPTFWTTVPYFPSSPEVYSKVAEQLPEGSKFSMVDLGSGFADLLFYLAKERPSGNYLGVELSPLPFLVSKLRSLKYPNVTIRYHSFWKLDFGEFYVVYAFLAPGPMVKLWNKVEREMGEGQMFMTNTFPVPSEPTETLELSDTRQKKLFIHKT